MHKSVDENRRQRQTYIDTDRVLMVDIKAIRYSKECCQQLVLGKLVITVEKNQTTDLPLLFPHSGPHCPEVFP